MREYTRKEIEDALIACSDEGEGCIACPFVDEKKCNFTVMKLAGKIMKGESAETVIISRREYEALSKSLASMNRTIEELRQQIADMKQKEREHRITIKYLEETRDRHQKEIRDYIHDRTLAEIECGRRHDEIQALRAELEKREKSEG